MKVLPKRIRALERRLMGGRPGDPALSGGISSKALRLLSQDDLDVLEIVLRDRMAGRDSVLNESQLASIESWKVALEQTCQGAGFASLAEYQRSQA
jgi:hypothetical protein